MRRRCRSLSTRTWSRHSRRTEPMSRSAKGFCHGLWRRQDLVDPHALHSLSERMSVDLIAIAEEVGRGGVVWEGVHDLLGRPGGGGMLGDVEVEDAPAIVGEHHEDEEHPQ